MFGLILISNFEYINDTNVTRGFGIIYFLSLVDNERI